jgi:hypothetical protein
VAITLIPGPLPLDHDVPGMQVAVRHDWAVIISRRRPDHGNPGGDRSPRVVTQEVVERERARSLLSPRVFTNRRCKPAKPQDAPLIQISRLRSLTQCTEYATELLFYRRLVLDREIWPQRLERDAV